MASTFSRSAALALFLLFPVLASAQAWVATSSPLCNELTLAPTGLTGTPLAQASTDSPLFTVTTTGLTVRACVTSSLPVGGGARASIRMRVCSGATCTSYVNTTLTKRRPENWPTGTIHAEDYGLKTLSARGSISKGSTSLVLQFNPGFQVGDHIIIPVDTTQAWGRVNSTEGPGGYWPGRSVTTTAGLAAVPFGTDYLVLADGLVYQRPGSSKPATPNDRYYQRFASPLALLATVTSVSGASLTLDRPAKGTVTNTEVVYDNGFSPFYQNVADGDWPSRTILLPPGRFASTEPLRIGANPRARLIGAGKHLTTLYSPLGIATGTLVSVTGIGAGIVSDFTVEGALHDQGYGSSQNANVGSFATGFDARGGVSGMILRDVRCLDVATTCGGVQYSNNVTWERVEAVQRDGALHYHQWAAGANDVSNGYNVRFIDIKMVGLRRYMPGIEAFRATGVSFIRPQHYNSFSSNNTAKDVRWVSPYYYFEQHFDVDEGLDPKGQPLDDYWQVLMGNAAINANWNVGGTSGNQDLGQQGPTITDPVIVWGGTAREAGTRNIAPGIIAAPNYTGIRIERGLYWVPPDLRTTQTTGSIAINLSAPTTPGMVADTVVSFRSYAKYQSNTDPKFTISLRSPGSGLVANNVAEKVSADGATITGNRTLAEYLAARGPNQLPHAGFRVEMLRGRGEFNVFAWTRDGSLLAYDPDGYIITYDCELLSASGAVLAVDHTGFCSFKTPGAGEFQIRQTVTDEDGATDSKTVPITVL